MKIVRLILLSLTLCCLSVPQARAQSGDAPVVNGEVVNQTPGGALPVGQEVTLQFFTEGEWTSIYTNTIESNGTFIFTDLGDEIGNDFVTRVILDDVEYFSEPTVLDGELNVEILVYDPTNDPGLIQIDQAHFFIVPVDGMLQIAEYYLLGNGGDKTFAGTIDSNTGERTTFTFSPPIGATGLSFDGPGLGERYIGDASQFSDTRPVPPGNATIDVSYQYELPYLPESVIDRALDIQIESVVLIVSGGEFGLQGPGVEFSGIMDTQMGPAASYTAGPLTALETFSFSVVPLMDGQSVQSVDSTPIPQTPRQRNKTQEIAIGSIVLIVAVIIAYQLWQTPVKRVMPEQAQSFVEQIAKLDSAYESGAFDESEYQKQRQALKREIRALLRK